MKLTKAQADFVMSWLAWAQNESADTNVWNKRDDELFQQIIKRYKRGNK